MSLSPADARRPLLSDPPHEDYASVSSTTTLQSSEATSDQPPDLIWILCGLYSAVFLGALDGSIVATLLASIGSDFEKADQASYIGTSYLLSMCCFTPLYGRLSDILGRKGAMLLALTLFGSGTAYCGFAPSMRALIIARTIAGAGGGGIMTVSSVAVTDLIPLKQRGLYQGVTNILFGLGAGLGGPLGGFINDYFGWRWAFVFQIPILIVSFLLVAWKVNIPLPDEIQSQTLVARLRRIDLPGSVTLVACVGGFLLACSLKSTEELPWTHPYIVGLLTASVVSAVCFVLVEGYWASYPLMPLRLLLQRNMLSACIANLVGSAAAYSMIYNVPLYFSAVRLTSAAAAGAHLLPHSVAISTGSVFAGWMMRKTGKLYRLTIASAVLSVIANVLVASWHNGTSDINLWLDVVPQGFGMSSLITSTLIAVIATVAKEDMAVATGITYLFRTTGQVLGVSLSGALLQTVLLSKLRTRITGPGAAQAIDEIRRSIAKIPTLEPHLRAAAVQSYADALRTVFVAQAALAFVMLLACVPIRESFLPGTREEQEEQYRRNAENGAGAEEHEV